MLLVRRIGEVETVRAEGLSTERSCACAVRIGGRHCSGQSADGDTSW